MPLTYSEFGAWYDAHRTRFLEPALHAAFKALNELLDRELAEPQRVRVQVRPGRVKSKARAWQKLNSKYAGQAATTDDVPALLDDLVGLRIVCTNGSDVDVVLELLRELPTFVDGDTPVLSSHADSERDYLSEPKLSGYRAFHLNLCTAVSWSMAWHPVTCELQVRTLLQDSWGELTHEDTYKPGTALPPLVDTLSKRMADLMATLDDLAQDLRFEMDRLAESAANSGVETLENTSVVTAQIDREAAHRFLADRVGDLDRPVPLASLAWEMQREFGQDVANGWVGHGSFKDLLQAACPDSHVSPQPPSYVVPEGFSVDAYATTTSADLPRAAALLNDADPSFPLVDPRQWESIYESLSWATRTVPFPETTSIQHLNDLTRVGRDHAAESGRSPTRRQLAYVGRALLFARELIPDMTPSLVGDLFSEWTVARAREMGLGQTELDELASWLRPAEEAPQSES